MADVITKPVVPEALYTTLLTYPPSAPTATRSNDGHADRMTVQSDRLPSASPPQRRSLIRWSPLWPWLVLGIGLAITVLVWVNWQHQQRAIRRALLLRIMDLVQLPGSGFAFPLPRDRGKP